MPVSTLSAAVYITPVVIKTFFRHGKRLAEKRSEKRDEEAQDDIFFDEAFHIVKAFIELGTKNTVESLQRFTNTHVPAPYWAAVASVCIPLQSCNNAADILIDWFGPDELKAVVGGERWWQVRGLEGVDGEWITEKEYLSDNKVDTPPGRSKLSSDDRLISQMEELDRVMFYVHGGGYFWGSITQTRTDTSSYAMREKSKDGYLLSITGRRPNTLGHARYKTCLQPYPPDLYLIKPPAGAMHKAIPPSKIVFAGDSAGGGLCVATLAILRDMGLPLPSGVVLISPWVDLTHSFPSVMENTETDIIPQHGFLAKPSTLWPVDPLPTKEGRVGPTRNSPPPDPGHADQLRPTKARVHKEEEAGKPENKDSQSPTPHSQSSGAELADSDDYDVDYWEPRPPQVQMNSPNAIPLELHAQIQLYATTEQLTHPLVSPILQGSLANLPPMYILAGNDEVLRDEIVYIAHRAAHPESYPIRKGALRGARRQKENAGKFTRPTKVHLQVFDDMCHVSTVFTFTESAKYAYRAIAAFVQHVTDHDEDHLARIPFPNHPLAKDTIPTVDTPQRTPSSDGTKVNGIVEKVTETTSTLENSDDGRMVRERVSIKGITRPMEPREEMSVLKLKPSQIGIIKEGPTIKWLKGQQEWDQKYEKSAARAIRQRQKNEEKGKRLVAHAREQGLALVSDTEPGLVPVLSASAHTTGGAIQQDRRWGPLDLDEERPPPTAIAKRLDTPDALALLKKHIYHTAPKTHRMIPKLKLVDAVRAAFDPNDDPNKAPKQSVSEAQVHNSLVPDSLHGLRIWDVLVGYFMRKSQEKATNGKNAIKEVVSGSPVSDDP